jgi:hypothetical protein
MQPYSDFAADALFENGTSVVNRYGHSFSCFVAIWAIVTDEKFLYFEIFLFFISLLGYALLSAS